jgi:hypothetical protein
VLVWFAQMSHAKTPEERLREAIVRGKDANPEDRDISISVASMIE